MAEAVQKIPVNIEEEMKRSYLDYAMSVIIGRALPDARDGLKPVHRRILYSMHDMGLGPGKPFKKSATIVGECFAAGTHVLTEQGLRPIEEIERGDRVYTQEGLAPVTELFEMPERDLLKVTLENGLSVTVTPSQPLKVLNAAMQYEWKQASEIAREDIIVVRASYPDKLAYVQLPDWNGREMFLDEDIAYLMGQYLSDGWFEKCNGRSCFYSTSPGVIGRVRATLASAFGYEARVETVHRKTLYADGAERDSIAYQIRVNRKAVNDYLSSTFDITPESKAPTKRVPQQFFRSPMSVIASLLSGLIDGDGSVHTKRNVIHYGTVSEKLAEDVHILLHHLGALSHRRIDRSKMGTGRIIDGRSARNNHAFFGIEVRGRFSQVLAGMLHLAHETKGSRLQRILGARIKETNYDRIPQAGPAIFNELSAHHLGGGWYKDVEGNKFRMGIKYSSGAKIRYGSNLREIRLRRTQLEDWKISDKLARIDSPLAPFVSSLLANDIYFLRVASVEAAPAQRTYDLEVAGEHEFIANGIVSHNCLGKYHPHGDTAVYDAMVRMAQDFSLRYPLINGQGNFGSVDGDAAAAYRYTEARLTRIATEMLADIDKETVDFVPNYDESRSEPTVLPTRFPNLLVNGSGGIAVGMATNIPPHNLAEVIEAAIYLIQNPGARLKTLMNMLPGPDFPTGGFIYGREGIHQAYETGRGSLVMRARVAIDRAGRSAERMAIVVTEIPYQINKAKLIERIAELINDKKIDGISDLRDESDREGMRVVIELKRDAIPDIVLNNLYKLTPMQQTFGVINLAIVNGQPRELTLIDTLNIFIEYRREVVLRRTRFELKKAEARAHILEGLKKALDNLDAVIELIRKARGTQEAREALMLRFKFSEPQARAILEMQLQRLTGLERQKLIDEYKEIIQRIAELQEILENEAVLRNVIVKELREVQREFGEERRTEIVEAGAELSLEDLIADEDVAITVTHSGYIKRTPVTVYRAQRRGGTGRKGASLKTEDVVDHLFVASTHSFVMIFTSNGQVYKLKVHEIPDSGAAGRGKAIVNLVGMPSGEKVAGIIPVRSFEEGRYVVMATRQGTIKKTEISEFANIRQSGIIAMGIDKGDELIAVELTDGNKKIFLATHEGMAICFDESDVRSMGRPAYGVRGITLDKGDYVISVAAVTDDVEMLSISEHGFGKRTKIEEYRFQSRGGKGVINMKTSDRNGLVVAVLPVNDDSQVLIITNQGKLIRVDAKTIRVSGRSTQGVKLIDTSDGDKVSSASLIEKQVDATDNGAA